MLTVHAADGGRVIHRALVLVALICSGLVLVSFGLFARDQVAGAAKTQAKAVVSSAPLPKPVKKQQGQPARFIDGAASKLTSPFQSIIQSTSAWVQHGVSTVLALLVYGVGIGFLARYSRGLA